MTAKKFTAGKIVSARIWNRDRLSPTVLDRLAVVFGVPCRYGDGSIEGGSIVCLLEVAGRRYAVTANKDAHMIQPAELIDFTEDAEYPSEALPVLSFRLELIAEVAKWSCV